jgi:hypothetical protein
LSVVYNEASLLEGFGGINLAPNAECAPPIELDVPDYSVMPPNHRDRSFRNHALMPDEVYLGAGASCVVERHESSPASRIPR